MIKEWATVVSWQNGIALVSCDVKASCNSCASRAGCGSRVLNKLGPQTSHTISVPSEQPLMAGQKVELGIAEGSLLSSAMLVYLSPLLGLFIMGGVFVMETLSVILQVSYFKMTHGKRIFLMTPIHHHFEMKGWKETQVVVRFWIITIVLVLIGLSTLKIR